MPITKLKYTSLAETAIQVTSDEGNYTAPWPCYTWHAQQIQAAIDGGLSIEPFMTAAEDLAAAQNELWDKIHTKRDDLSFNGGVKVAVAGVDKWFYTTQAARTEYSNLYPVMVDHPDHSVDGWRTMDGSFVTMTKALLAEIQLNGILQASAVFNAGVAHETAMMALTTAADVLAYDFSTGWPAVYGD